MWNSFRAPGIIQHTNILYMHASAYFTPWRSTHQSKRSKCLQCFENHTFCSTMFREWKRASEVLYPHLGVRKGNETYKYLSIYDFVYMKILKEMRLGIFLSVQIGRRRTMPQCLSDTADQVHGSQWKKNSIKRDSNHSIVFFLFFSFVLMLLLFLVRRKTLVYK